jgi:hypothetical protein
LLVVLSSISLIFSLSSPVVCFDFSAVPTNLAGDTPTSGVSSLGCSILVGSITDCSALVGSIIGCSTLTGSTTSSCFTGSIGLTALLISEAL